MLDRPNRTFIPSALFRHIVGYSKLPLTEQIRLKAQCGLPPDTKRQSISVDADDTRLIVISC